MSLFIKGKFFPIQSRAALPIGFSFMTGLFVKIKKQRHI